MFTPMFHGQNRSSRLITDPGDVVLTTPDNYLWINSQLSNINRFETGGIYYVSSYINIVDVSESIGMSIDGGGRPLWIDNYYGTFDSSTFGNGGGYLGIRSSSMVSMEYTEEAPYQSTWFVFLDIDFDSMNSDYRFLWWGAPSTVHTEFHGLYLLINNTNIVAGYFNDTSYPYSLTILGTYAHGFSGKNKMLLSFNSSTLYINGVSRLTYPHSYELNTSVQNLLGIYVEPEFNNISTFGLPVPCDFIEAIMYPRYIPNNERIGVENWFNAKYSIW